VSESTTYLEQITEMSTFLDKATAELSESIIRQRPGAELNPLGFIYWHILRIWDFDLNVLIGGRPAAEDAWHRGGYSEAMDYSPDGKGGGGLGLGFGYTDSEVDEIPYSLDVIRRYHQQMIAETTAYLATADDAELHREFPFREATISPRLRMQHIVGHSWTHIGEIRMTKSMLGFPDPTTPPRNPKP
jgi:hypothetical protein